MLNSEQHETLTSIDKCHSNSDFRNESNAHGNRLLLLFQGKNIKVERRNISAGNIPTAVRKTNTTQRTVLVGIAATAHKIWTIVARFNSADQKQQTCRIYDFKEDTRRTLKLFLFSSILHI